MAGAPVVQNQMNNALSCPLNKLHSSPALNCQWHLGFSYHCIIQAPFFCHNVKVFFLLLKFCIFNDDGKAGTAVDGGIVVVFYISSRDRTWVLFEQ